MPTLIPLQVAWHNHMHTLRITHTLREGKPQMKYLWGMVPGFTSAHTVPGFSLGKEIHLSLIIKKSFLVAFGYWGLLLLFGLVLGSN